MTTQGEEDLAARIDAATALRALGHAIIAHDIDVEQLESITSSAERLLAEVEESGTRTHAFRRVGSFAMPEPAGKGEKPTHLFQDSIVSGSANPLGMNATLWQEDGQAVMKVTLGPAHEGAPGRAHGGLVAALIDETMGLVLGIIRTPAFTGRLTVTYRAPTPLGVELTGTARVIEQRGRKITMAAEVRAGDELIAEGDGLFISVDPEHFVASK
jgi:acyl-coenzyme A thioesterase PaaI-like protein